MLLGSVFPEICLARLLKLLPNKVVNHWPLVIIKTFAFKRVFAITMILIQFFLIHFQTRIGPIVSGLVWPTSDLQSSSTLHGVTRWSGKSVIAKPKPYGPIVIRIRQTLATRGRQSTDVTIVLLTHLPWVRITAQRTFLSQLLSLWTINEIKPF